MAIQREAWRQQKAIRFAQEAITCPHTVMAFDRSQARGRLSHMFEAQRGVRAGTPDTLTIVNDDGRVLHIWVEWKAPGAKPTETQLAALGALRRLGDTAVWCSTIEDYMGLLSSHRVPMVPNAAILAQHYDLMVEGRIAKAEGAMPGVKRAPRKPRATTPGKWYRKANAQGLI